MSVLGFGASPLGGVFETVDEARCTLQPAFSSRPYTLTSSPLTHAPTLAQDEGVASVHEAVRQGINFFDCSPCAPDVAILQVST